MYNTDRIDRSAQRFPHLAEPTSPLDSPSPYAVTKIMLKGFPKLYNSTHNNITRPASEDADVVADALLLVLRYALGNPCDVANFLVPG